MVERDRAQTAIRRMRFACSISKATYTHTHRICNNYCFSTATIFARMRFITTYTHTLPLMFLPKSGLNRGGFLDFV